MSFAIRGVIESFYDRLWSWEERGRFAAAVAAMGFNVYAWAPKEDRLQNAGWRTPYPSEERHRITAFAEVCRRDGMTPWFGLRPVGISYADDDDGDRVVRKLLDHLELGAGGLVLLADDIPASLDAAAGRRFADLAEAHAWLIDRVTGEIGGARLVFCPTEYAGMGGGYLRRLGTMVPAEVDMFWTGPDVCSGAITAAQATAVADVLRRPPLVWDNYPVNDAAMTDELHIGPIRDRDACLAEVTAGVLVNPAMEPEASLVPMATWGEFLADPLAYDPDAAWERALLRVAGTSADAAAVAALATQCDRSVIDQPWRSSPAAPVDPVARRAASIANRRLAGDLRRFVEALPAG